jgi:hypothetical protein
MLAHTDSQEGGWGPKSYDSKNPDICRFICSIKPTLQRLPTPTKQPIGREWDTQTIAAKFTNTPLSVFQKAR